MEILKLRTQGAYVINPQVFVDDRGFFMETFQKKVFDTQGIDVNFVQDNHSGSVKGVIRGLHYQLNHAQGKLVRAVKGSIYDVGVDIRRNSPTFGQFAGIELSEDNKLQAWFPAGYAHGFLVLSEYAEIVYKTTDYYDPQSERTILWNDPVLKIDWPIKEDDIITLSDKDAKGNLFLEADVYDI